MNSRPSRRIWYLSAHDQPGGQSPRTFDFARALAQRGHSVTMFTNSYCHFTHVERLGKGEKWRIEHDSGVRVVWLRTYHYVGNGADRALNMVSNVLRALQASRTIEGTPDVVIGPSVPLLTGWAALHLARRHAAAFVFEVRDVWPQALVDLGVLRRNSIAYGVARWLEKYLYRNAHRITAVLPGTSEHVGASGADRGKVRWIPNGIDLERTPVAPPTTKTTDGLVAMYVGGFSATHDVANIVSAAKIVLDRGLPVRFVVVGSGPGRSECISQAARLGIANIEFHDRVAKENVPALLREADILIASVRDTPVYRFGINSNKIYDYLAAGRPVVFAGNAPNDPISESGGGLRVPPGDPQVLADAIERLVRLGAQARSEMGQRGRAYLERAFSLSKLVDRMETTLEEAIQARTHHGT